MSGGFFVKVAIGLAIDGQAGGAVIGDAALRRFALQREVFLAGEYLHLRERENPFWAWQFETHKAGRQPVGYRGDEQRRNVGERKAGMEFIGFF